MANLPQISVVTPVQNARAFIERAILSVLDQGYPNLEYIIIDGGSADRTVDIIRSYEEELAYWISEQDRGQSHALNKGFAKATGDVLTWLNADEEYRPGALWTVGEAFSANPRLDIVFGNRIVTNADGQVIRYEKVPNLHPRHFMLFAHGLLFSDATFWSSRMHRLTGQLDEESFQHLAMDFDWFLRMSIHVEKWLRLDEYLSVYKHHPGRKSLDVPEMPLLARKARSRVIEEQAVSRAQLLLGWIWFGSLARIHREGLRGLLRLARFSTVFRMMNLHPSGATISRATKSPTPDGDRV